MAIELGTTGQWVKSTHSMGNGECVEVRSTTTELVSVRDSKVPDGPVLDFRPGSWAAFVAEVNRGAFGPE